MTPAECGMVGNYERCLENEQTQGLGLFLVRSWPFILGGQKIKSIYREQRHLQSFNIHQNMKKMIQKTVEVMIYKYEELK